MMTHSMDMPLAANSHLFIVYVCVYYFIVTDLISETIIITVYTVLPLKRFMLGNESRAIESRERLAHFRAIDFLRN